jgi:hypothetical protein
MNPLDLSPYPPAPVGPDLDRLTLLKNSYSHRESWSCRAYAHLMLIYQFSSGNFIQGFGLFPEARLGLPEDSREDRVNAQWSRQTLTLF